MPKRAAAWRIGGCLAASALFWVAALAAVASVTPGRCAGSGIDVAGWGTTDQARVCAASAAAVAFLEAAGIAYSNGLTIAPLPTAGEMGDERHIGSYETVHNEIRVLTYAAALAASRRHPPAFDTPMSLALWESFISHETAHAVIEQRFAAGVQRWAASEYIAAVVQLGTMPLDLRRTILTRYDNEAFGDRSEISILIYLFDPAVFAVKSYRHYVALGNRGPKFIADILREGLDR